MKIRSGLLPILLLLLPFLNLQAQSTASSSSQPARPKLIVGLVIDQMRWDFFYRYADKYGEGGFKRLLREGYNCQNTHINYSPSYTAPGHASAYTGSVPAVHGITGNNWYDEGENKIVYCAEDTTVTTVGSASRAGLMSPRRMLTTTVTDELRLATNFRSKVIGIALKDRGAILPAGHTANAAYFFDNSSGGWISSSYYMNDLPQWVKTFNQEVTAQKFIAKNWNTTIPIGSYVESTHDDEDFENAFKGEAKAVFPHQLSELKTSPAELLRSSPFGNTYSLDFARSAIANENLGKGNYTDFLALSLSSTDYIGHQFGPNSVEVEDCYIRLDKDLAAFFLYLDNNIGKGNYLFFLTADHGAAHVPAFLNSIKIPAGVFQGDTILKQLEAGLSREFGEGEWILDYSNMQLKLNDKLIVEKKVNRDALKQSAIKFLRNFTSIARVVDLENLEAATLEPGIKTSIANCFYPKRSGELYILFEPGWLEGFSKGTTHGTIYPYDTHIPLVWMGWHIKPAEDQSQIHMTDIAPTLAALLHIQEPNGCTGKVIKGIFKR